MKRTARADLCRRMGRRADAIAAYERALALTKQEPERRFLMRRLAEMGSESNFINPTRQADD